MPVQRATIFAISSSDTLSRRREFSLCAFSAAASASKSSLCRPGSLPYFSSAARDRSYSFCAISIAALVASISSRILCARPMESRSFSHRAFIELNSSRRLASVSSVLARRSAESLSSSFLSAASSISSCMMRREISSSSMGIEFISVLMRAHASSTRSIALSGRKRSEI